jgi:UDP-glucuronate 4-epimerase
MTTPPPARPIVPGPAAPGATVLVTGAAGFIGSYVCQALMARGQHVVGLDNFDPYYDPGLKRENLDAVRAAARPDARFRFIEADICDQAALRDVLERDRPETVIHLAAKAGVRPSIADPAGYARVNVLGTSIVLEESRRAGVRRVVMASSSSVYGDQPKAPFAETDDVSAPVSPYAATKRACELLAHTHHHLTGMPVACLRFFTVFGPRQRPDLAIMGFMSAISEGRTIRLFGDGSTSRDYTFVADIVDGVLAAVDRIDQHGYRVWNLGHAHPVTLSDMVASIARVVGREPVIERRPVQPGDVQRTFADLSRSGAELGYRPRTTFAQGLEAQWAWLKARRP